MQKTLQNIIALIRNNPLVTLITVVLVLILINAVLAPVFFSPIYTALTGNTIGNAIPLADRVDATEYTPFPLADEILMPYQGAGFLISQISRDDGGNVKSMEVYIASDEGRLNFLSWLKQFSEPGTTFNPTINYHEFNKSE